MGIVSSVQKVIVFKRKPGIKGADEAEDEHGHEKEKETQRSFGECREVHVT
jgi:hypothetical protein